MTDSATVRTGPGDRTTWEAAAAAVARKARRLAADAPDNGVWQALAHRTVEDVTIPPVGIPEDASTDAARSIATTMAHPATRAPSEAEGSIAAWDVRAPIADSDPATANSVALDNLEGGATSLWIRLGDAGSSVADLDEVLAGVRLDMAPVDFGPCTTAQAREVGQWLAGRGDTIHPSSGLGADPLGLWARTVLGESASPSAAASPPAPSSSADAGDPEDLKDLGELAALADRLGLRALVVDGSVVHEAGAGDAGEIGYTLAAGVAYLRALTDAGVDIDAATDLLEFRYAVTDEQFVSIAKLRAARVVWDRVAELCGAGPEHRAQHQHAVTSWPMLTRYDPWVNMLRGTVATFAAAVGGAQAVTALPFDATLGIPDEFAHRMARNISALLDGESHVRDVGDPAGGSYAVERLTAELATAAWAEFQAIEASGGLAAALADGSLAARVAAVSAERSRRIATRRRPITGVSEFPDSAEDSTSLPERRGSTPSGYRWAAPFERLRDSPCAAPAVVVTIGDQAAASSRLLFVRNLLVAGGIRIVEADVGRSLDEVLQKAGTGTVVLTGADADYAASLHDSARTARAAGATDIFVAGRSPAVVAALDDGSVDGAVAAGDDVLSFLTAVRATLGGAA